MKTETITWHELPDDGMPDAETTVLLQIRELDDDGTDVMPGWWAGERWVDITGWPLQAERVVAWADQPVGVSAC